MKCCPRCNEQDQSQFTEKARYCKTCIRIFNRRWSENNGIPEKFIPEITDTCKQCCICKDLKPFSDYSPSPRGRLGLASYCKTCMSQYQLIYTPVEERRKKTQTYRDNNREWWRSLHRINQFNRKQLVKAQSDGTVTKEFIASIYNTAICYYCECGILESLRTLEHKHPLNKGGLHSVNNIVMACFSCNSSKRDMTESEFKIYKDVQRSYDSRLYNE